MAFYQKLRDLLFEAGLSELETMLYIDLLKKPAENVWELVRRLKFPKSSIYLAFTKLEELKMVEKNADGIRALSLKVFISKLAGQERKIGKISSRLKQLSPFLRTPDDTIEKFETFYTKNDIAEIYMFMAEHTYGVNFDFGDFDGFIAPLPIDLALRFREKRASHAKHHAICTTFGPKLALFFSKSDVARYQNQFEMRKDIAFQNRWIIFTDTSDYIFFSDMSDPEYPTATLIKSKTIADMQRLQFQSFSKTPWKEKNEN